VAVIAVVFLDIAHVQYVIIVLLTYCVVFCSLLVWLVQ